MVKRKSIKEEDSAVDKAADMIKNAGNKHLHNFSDPSNCGQK